MIRVKRLNCYISIDEKNLSYYERLGYKIVEEKQDSKGVEEKTSTPSLNSKPKTTRKKKTTE